MNRRYFGTDGVRGPYGGPVINAEFAARLGYAAARWLTGGGERRQARGAETELALERRQERGIGPVLIGRDTRASGAALEAGVARGLLAAGAEPISLGVLPTPAVARAVRAAGARLGVVITASHNPAGDNGIKLFGPHGVKLTDRDELAVEALLPEAAAGPAAVVPRRDGERERYIAGATALLPAGALRGWRIVLDTANGATCETSPAVLRALGAEVHGIGDTPDGANINADVGSEHPERMAQRVLATGAQIGVAHDGDGDRCIVCDERGAVLDGDEILTILATDALARGALANGVLVVTVQSNLGVDAAVAAAGGRVVRTAVGDRYVIERMRDEGASLGGESSGHLICADVSTTGDGLVAALRLLDAIRRAGKPLSELRRVLRRFPQKSTALEVREKRPLEGLHALPTAIAALEAELGAAGRVLVRYSGTEPKLRLLVEGPNDEAVERGLARLVAAARSDLAVV